VELRDRFPQTSWTLVARAAQTTETQARDDFARLYFQPVVAFLQVKVRDANLAEELAQDFFCRLLEKPSLFQNAQARHGSFRTYLMASLQNFASDYFRRWKRGNEKETHPDQWEDAGWEGVRAQNDRAAEAVFHAAWVKATLESALASVREICARKSQMVHLQLFEARYLCADDSGPSWSELGVLFGLEQKTARERADTVARHFRIVLRKMLSQQVNLTGPDRGTRWNEARIDKEIQALMLPLKD
jgi:DNA-directed RNA polymerase specialized sigma24 family protein